LQAQDVVAFVLWPGKGAPLHPPMISHRARGRRPSIGAQHLLEERERA
jgi:hypothetical protein